MLTLSFINQWPEAWQRAVEKAFASLQASIGKAVPTGTINLKLISDKEIAELNERSSGLTVPTDVLTFNYQESGTDTYGELADIVISSETAERQAEAAGTTSSDEIALLAVHGILHTIGYDHAEPKARRELDRLQATIMDAAGLAYRDFQWID